MQIRDGDVASGLERDFGNERRLAVGCERERSFRSECQNRADSHGHIFQDHACSSIR